MYAKLFGNYMKGRKVLKNQNIKKNAFDSNHDAENSVSDYVKDFYRCIVQTMDDVTVNELICSLKSYLILGSSSHKGNSMYTSNSAVGNNYSKSSKFTELFKLITLGFTKKEINELIRFHELQSNVLNNNVYYLK